MFSDPRTADRLTGLVLLMLGIAMLVGGYTMDRLEIRQIHPASIPGLVPMGLGAAMIICSVLLILSASRQTAQALAEQAPPEQGSTRNLLVSVALCLFYVLVLLGRMPFAVATGLFMFAFALYFSWESVDADPRSRARLVLFVAIFAAIFSSAISLLFRYGFLVRLP